MGNYNKSNAQAFADALLAHVADAQVQQIVGTYRREPVIHYVDLMTFVDVMTLPDGTFHSVWKLNPKQAQNVIQRGSL